MGLFEHFPYTNFHSLNIEWAIEKIKELLQQGETLYAQLQQWKTDTDEDLDAWKAETLSNLEGDLTELRQYIDDVEAGMEQSLAATNALIASAQNDIDSVSNYLNRVDSIIPLVWEQGTINADGEFPNTTIIRTVGYMPVVTGQRFLIKCDRSSYNYRIFTYSYDGTTYNLVDELTATVLMGGYKVASGVTHIRIRLTHTPQQTTRPSEGAAHFTLIDATNHTFSVTDFGAVGDGVTDDTASFQRALTFGTPSIHVPTAAGQKYLVTDTLSVSANTKAIYGDLSEHNRSSPKGRILFSSTGTASDIKFLISTNIQCLRITNLIFDGVNKSNYTGVINLPGSTQDKDFSMEYCEVNDFWTVFFMRGRGFKFCNNLVASTAEVGTITVGPNDGPTTSHPFKYEQRAILVNSNRFHSISGSNRAMIKVNQGHANGMEICNNLVDLGYTPFFSGATSPSTSEMGPLWNAKINNNTLMGCNISSAWIALTRGARNCQFNGNTFFDAMDYTDNQSAIASRAIYLSGTIVNCTVCNNNIDGAGTAGIYLGNASGTVICNNAVTESPTAIELAGTLTACTICNNTHLSATAGDGTMFSGTAQLNYCKVFNNTHNNGSGINNLTFNSSNSSTDETPD